MITPLTIIQSRDPVLDRTCRIVKIAVKQGPLCAQMPPNVMQNGYFLPRFLRVTPAVTSFLVLGQPAQRSYNDQSITKCSSRGYGWLHRPTLRFQRSSWGDCESLHSVASREHSQRFFSRIRCSSSGSLAEFDIVAPDAFATSCYTGRRTTQGRCRLYHRPRRL